MTLQDQIVRLHGRSYRRTDALSLGRDLLEARARVEAGELGKIKFRNWYHTNFPGHPWPLALQAMVLAIFDELEQKTLAKTQYLGSMYLTALDHT
jgi:hypothetical protein